MWLSHRRQRAAYGKALYEAAVFLRELAVGGNARRPGRAAMRPSRVVKRTGLAAIDFRDGTRPSAMIALWQQFRMADLNRSRLDILSDIVVILCRRAQNFLDIRLMRDLGYLSCPLRLPAIVFGRVHTLRTLSRRKLIQYKASGTRVQRLTASSTGHDP